MPTPIGLDNPTLTPVDFTNHRWVAPPAAQDDSVAPYDGDPTSYTALTPSISFDASGRVTALMFGGVSVWGSPAFPNQVNSAGNFRFLNSETQTDTSNATVYASWSEAWNSGTKTITRTYGSSQPAGYECCANVVVSIRYEIVGNDLRCHVTIVNGGPYRLIGGGYAGRTWLYLFNSGTPAGLSNTIGTGYYTSGTLNAIGQPGRALPMCCATFDGGTKVLWAGILSSNTKWAYGTHGQAAIDKLFPGDTATYTIVFRAVTGDQYSYGVMQDIIDAWVTENDDGWRWSDRRAIGMYAEFSATPTTGNRSCINSGPLAAIEAVLGDTFDESIEGHRDAAVTYLVDRIDSVIIPNLESRNCQGSICWDYPGNPPSDAFAYTGDPRIGAAWSDICYRFALAFCRKLGNAGFRSGFCVRPNWIWYSDASGWNYWQANSAQVHPGDWTAANKWAAAQLMAKVVWAWKHFGATLFYVDTAAVLYQSADKYDDAIEAAWYRAARQACNDEILLIPEDETGVHYFTCFPYKNAPSEMAQNTTWRDRLYRHSVPWLGEFVSTAHGSEATIAASGHIGKTNIWYADGWDTSAYEAARLDWRSAGTEYNWPAKYTSGDPRYVVPYNNGD